MLGETVSSKLMNLWMDMLELDLAYNKVFFLFFLLLFFLLYFAVRGSKAREIVILAANLVFYLWNGWGAFCIVLFTGIVTYVVGRGLERRPKNKRLLAVGLVLVLGIWVVIKIAKLSLPSVTTWGEVFDGMGILVPLGLSYYSLSSIGYMLDVYWENIIPEHNFRRLFTIMIYFPHIVQGPIGRYQKLLEQLKNLPAFEHDRVCLGLQLSIWGWIKKMVIADKLALYTSAVFAAPKDYAGMEILIAVILCTIQLYADFSGCVDIVRGISQAVGIELEQNFQQPFFSKSAAEFWRRWHITLGAWFKDYVFMPFVVNSYYVRMISAVKKTYGKKLGRICASAIPLAVVWLVTGLWHGTGWNYIVWGLYYGIIIILSQCLDGFYKKIKKRLHINEKRFWFVLWQMIRTSLIFAISRMFTVTETLSDCALLWKRLFSELRLWVLFDGSLYTHGLDRKDFYIALTGMLLMLAVDIWHEKGIKIRETLARQPRGLRWIVYYAAIFSIVIFGAYGYGFDAASFAYGAF